MGPHGGAFSNLIFLDPEKKPIVIEFCPCLHKSFSNLFDGAIETFAEYHQIPFIIPLEATLRIENEKISPTAALKDIDSTVDLSILKQVLPLLHKPEGSIV